MGYLYFDESERSPHFALGAFVYSEIDLNVIMHNLLASHGMDPNIFEFKSSNLFSISKSQNRIRDDLFKIISSCKIAIVLSDNKKNMGIESLEILPKLLSNNSLLSQPHEVFFDQGLLNGRRSSKVLENAQNRMPLCRFNFECDSRLTRGIQVSDLVAYSCGSWLLTKIGINRKSITIQRYKYAPLEYADLAWEFFLRLRYSFFFNSKLQNFNRDLSCEDLNFDMKNFGYFPLPSCSEKVKKNADIAFGKIYLGCTV